MTMLLSLCRRLQKAGGQHFKVIINSGQGHDYSQPYILMVTEAFETNGRFVPGFFIESLLTVHEYDK